MKTSIALIVAALALGGCASSQAAHQPTAPEQATQSEAQPKPGMGGGMAHDGADTCPMGVQGTTARGEDVEGGAAMAFTTTGDVAELRRRISHMAEMHNEHHGEGKGMMGEGKGMMMPPSSARSEEVEGGARLVFTPADPGDLLELREHAHQHAEQMASGQCPMMSMHGQGAEATRSVASAHEAHPSANKN